MNRRSRLALAIVLIALGATPALATWPNQSALNVPVCTSASDQYVPTIVSDGAGGAIVTWFDYRSGTSYDVYAQHVLVSGAVDPAWPANGRAVCTAASDQYSPTIVSDGAGGAIITWYDYRSGTSDIYAQHVLVSGAVDPAWPANGRALCTAAGYQYSPTIVSDGAGGAIVTWYDYRSGTGYDIYAQHVLASGALDPAWPATGTALCTAGGDQYSPTTVSDGAGGAIVAWPDYRSGNSDIYAQHVLASGAVDPAWPLDGRALCTAANNQQGPAIVSDGAGGAIVTWYDSRSGTSNDIYAQHVTASGAVDPSWSFDGRALCTAANDQQNPTTVSDGAGGAIVTWQDLRSGTNYDIYAQHLLASGAVDPVWPANGRALCTAASDQNSPTIVSDGAGGAIVTWYDFRSGASYDIYAQHVTPSGAVDPAWPFDGRALSTATGNQSSPASVSDGAGGAIVTWPDLRSGSTYDIYTQRIARFGYLGTPEAEIAGIKDVLGDNGGKVKLSWNASYLDLAQDANLAAYDIWRSVPSSLFATRLAHGDRATSSYAEASAQPGRLLITRNAAQAYAWEFVSTQPAVHYISVYSLLAPTAGDSIGAGNRKTAFMVVARNAANTMYWLSAPDSGYSVDNVAPFTPAPFTANYASGTAYLHWNPNAEPDLAGYRLYRGGSASFTPSPASLIASPADTGYADVSGAPYVYKLTAIDAHGNESPVATIVPTGTTGVGDGPALSELALAPASPNPASRGTTLRFALPAGASASLGMYDAAGRLVRTLTRGALPAGEHTAAWDLRDGDGRAVGAGLYFARLEVGGLTLVRRVAVTR